jgi:hypothetical protein
MTSSPLKWILVAGTGLVSGVPENVQWCSETVGRSLARNGYGLVVGGWHGVDYLSASAFYDELRLTLLQARLSDFLIQVVPRGSNPVFQGGHVIMVDQGVSEWVQPLRHAHGVFLVGGVGGTFETFRFALQERRPVLPIAATGGDATKAYNEVIKLWAVDAPAGISRKAFESTLGQEINTKADAEKVADDAIGLMADALEASDPQTRRDKIFISYAHRDKDWAAQIKQQLTAPLRGAASVWDDSQIKTGSYWSREIQKALSRTKAAVLIVTPAFLTSKFIREHELPFLFRAAELGQIDFIWLPVERSRHQKLKISIGKRLVAPFAEIQAALDPMTCPPVVPRS